MADTIRQDNRNILQKGLDWIYNVNWAQPTIRQYSPSTSLPSANIPASGPAETKQVFKPNSTKQTLAPVLTQPTNTTTTNQPTSDSNQNINSEIDSIYNPLNQALSNYQSELEKQRPIAIEEAKNQSVVTGNELDRSLNEYASNRDTAQKTVQDQYRSAYDQAVREANNLKQSGMSRFGGGSSTGGAISELLGQQFMRGSTQIKNTMLQGINQAFAYYENASKFVNDKKLELNQALATEVKKLNSLYDQKRQEVEVQKYANDSAKQAARVDMLREQMANSQTLANQKNAAELELSIWKEQLKSTLQANLAKNAESILSVPNIGNVELGKLGGSDGTQVPVQSRNVPSLTSYQVNSPELTDTALQGNTFSDLFNVFA